MSQTFLAPAASDRTLRAVILYPLFFGLIGIWTYLLVTPNPIPEVKEEIPIDWHFAAAKSLHAGAYASLAVLMMFLPMPAASAHVLRPLFIGFLLLHGVATETLQTYIPGREGCIRDALIDWLGVAFGVGITWPLWRPR
jgi:VanZ family protein